LVEFRTLFESGQIWVVDCLTTSYPRAVITSPW